MSTRTFFLFTSAILSLTLSTAAFAETIPLSSLDLVQSAPGTTQLIDGGTVLQLTPNFDTNPGGALSPAGAAWAPSQFNVADPFSVNFQFQFTDPTGHLDNGNGGDGIAFLIQNSSQGTSALGLGAGGMGFLGITDSVAIMLDTYQNNSPDFYGDPSNNYIAVNTRGTDFNVPHHFCEDVVVGGKDLGMQLTADPTLPSDLNGSSFSPYCTANPTLGMTGYGGVPALPSTEDMDDGAVHDLGIVYTGSALDIYLDSTLVLAVSIDLATTLDLQGGTDAFLGFTAGTRFAYQNQDVLDLTFTPEPAWGQLWVPMAMILVVMLARKWRRGRS